MTERRTVLPAPLWVAVGLTGLEALALLLSAFLELVNISALRLTMGVSTALFFALYAAGLLLASWGLTRLATWARAPVVLAQLIQLGVAWSFRGGSTTPVAVVLAVVAVAVLVGVLHPASTAVLVDDPTGEGRASDD